MNHVRGGRLVPHKAYLRKAEVLKINKNIAWRIIDGEIFIVTPSDRTLHSLNEVGTFIFKEIEKKIPIQDIVDKICKEYDIERNVAEKDLLEFVEKLKEKNIVYE